MIYDKQLATIVFKWFVVQFTFFLDKLLLSFFFVAKPLLRRPKSFPASVNFWFELFACCFSRKICIISLSSTQSHTMLSNIPILTAFLHSHGGLGGSSWEIKKCEWEIIHRSRRTISHQGNIRGKKGLKITSSAKFAFRSHTMRRTDTWSARVAGSSIMARIRVAGVFMVSKKEEMNFEIIIGWNITFIIWQYHHITCNS